MNLLQHSLIIIVRLYQWLLSPAKMAILGPAARCRFTPSCSEYTLQAIRHHGAMRGSLLAIGRICRCHPWGGAGPDPVPEPRRRFLPAAQAGSQPASGPPHAPGTAERNLRAAA